METLGGNICGWWALSFLAAQRKWALTWKHEFPLESVSLNEHLKLQIVFFFFEVAQNHIVVIFWFLSQPQIFKCQNLAKPPANVCHGHWPTKTANSNESLHSGTALKLNPAREAGPTCAYYALCYFALACGCAHYWNCVDWGRDYCPLLPLFSFLYQWHAPAANPSFTFLSSTPYPFFLLSLS